MADTVTMARTADPDRYVTESVREMPVPVPPLSAGEYRLARGEEPCHVLNLNECPLPPSPRVIEAMVAVAADANRYPTSRGAALREAIAEQSGVPAGRVVLGNGSDEILQFCADISLRGGDSAVMPAPSFPRYRVATLLRGARPIQAGLSADGSNDVRALLGAVENDTRVVFCCNPNNPSGGYLDEEALIHLVESTPDDVLLVLDEAYYEFARALGLPESLPLLARRRGPWVITRTFSKAYALAGVRLGYALAGSDDVADSLMKRKPNFNINAFAAAAGHAALGDDDHLAHVLESCRRERERLAAGLRDVGFAPLPSAANFVSFDTGTDGDRVIDALRDRGVLVRDWRHPDYPSFVRITVGTPEDTDAALEAIAALRLR